MIASLSENVVGTCRRNKAKPPIKANVFYIKNGGRTWARTKDPLIKSFGAWIAPNSPVFPKAPGLLRFL